MAAPVRWMLCLAWLAGACWLWRAGVLGAVMASLLAAPALLLPWMPRATRRRRGELQYVQMAKAPVAAR